MKRLLTFASAALVMATVAQADFVMGRVRPTAKASLVVVDDAGQTFPKAEEILVNHMDGSSKPVSFTLLEDTGIRCIKAPCPSAARTDFKVLEIKNRKNGDVEYTAVEELKNIPPNVRIARRYMVVTETNIEGVQELIVEVKSLPNVVKIYEGELEYLAVTL